MLERESVRASLPIYVSCQGASVHVTSILIVAWNMEKILLLLILSGVNASIKFEELRNSLKVNAVIEILHSCFSNDLRRGLGLVGDAQQLAQIQWTENLIPLMILENSSSQLDFVHKLPVFLVTVEPNLKKNFQFLKNSSWWNHDGYFIIVDSAIGKCENAEVILQTA